MIVKLLYILGILIGLYAIINNISGIFNVNFSDPTLAVGKILVSLFPIIAGGVIVYVSGYNLIQTFKGEKNEQNNKKS